VLASTRDRWHGSPPADVVALFEAADRVRVLLPRELESLLEAANGLEIPAVGVTIESTSTIAPVEGTRIAAGQPGAIWFARKADGTRFAVTVSGWREADEGRVVRISPGTQPADAPLMGTLPDVVRQWLAEGVP